MYRYSVDNRIVYTPEDLVLFRESPFASWMERLTLENPNHGIKPDPEQAAACPGPWRQSVVSVPTDSYWGGIPLDWEAFVDGVSVKRAPLRHASADAGALLRAQGKEFVSIGRHLAEAERRSATERAMCAGAEFIVDGQLALGPMACRVDLLMRCDGISEFGCYLYLPCAFVRHAGHHITHELCFAADLLQSLQGAAPAQLLLLGIEHEIKCLNASDHMPYFRELKYAFMSAQLSFRKHRVPDPAQSSHFGRWSRCAREMLAQRAKVAEQRATAPDAGAGCAPLSAGRNQGTRRLAPANGEGLAAAMKRALSMAGAARQDNDLIDRDTPSGDHDAQAAATGGRR